MEGRRAYAAQQTGRAVPATAAADAPQAEIIVPILCEGDVLGCVLFLQGEGKRAGELELKLAGTVAGFLGKQMET